MNVAPLLEELKAEEGLRLSMYRDSVGVMTIGYGHNLDERPISKRAAEVILEDDMAIAVEELMKACPWVARMDEVRARVLADLCFNMGMPKLKTFRKMLAACQLGNFYVAGDELIDSDWYGEVGGRGPLLVGRLKTGKE